MRKDRKSINIMMIIIILVSIMGIGANIFLIRNDKENDEDTILESNEIKDKQYAVGIQENTIQAVKDITPEASITDNTQATIEDITQQNAIGQATTKQNVMQEDTIQEKSNLGYYIDGASSVNIRSSDNNQSDIVGWLAKGTEVEMINKGKYYSYIKHGNIEGYVYNEYISQK